MKILFVASGNKGNGNISPIVEAQAESIRQEGVEVLIFPVVGKGIFGYIKNIFPLKRFIRKNKPDIIHAHYSIYGFLASLVTKKPVICSIMGSFPVNKFKIKKQFVKLFAKYCWKETITKSKLTKDQLNISKIHIIPNGVNLELFDGIDRKTARENCHFSDTKKYIIFVSNPARPEKNFKLAEDSVNLLNDSNIELVPVFNMPHSKVAEYMAAADVLILSSTNEGSPNVIKEAMASNLPIVTTDVGNVEWLLERVEGCFVAKNFEAKEIAELLKKSLCFDKTKGRNKLIELNLDSKTVAHKLIELYKKYSK